MRALTLLADFAGNIPTDMACPRLRDVRAGGGIDVEVDIEQYYRRYGPMVLRRCQRLLRNESIAFDAMHDVFVQLLRHRSRLRHEAPAGLLLRTATHICLNRMRSAARRPEDSDEDLLLRIAMVEEPGERSLARRVLEQLFAGERESTRTIAVMHLVDGLTLEEVAKEVRLSVSGVRKRLRNLRGHLRELEGVDP